MAQEFKWSIEKLVVTGVTNVVTHVHWRCDATDQTFSAASSGIRELTLGDSFTQYADLTEQQVLDWCYAPVTITWEDREEGEKLLTKYLKNDIETELSNQLQRRADKKTVEPTLPWNTTSSNS